MAHYLNICMMQKFTQFQMVQLLLPNKDTDKDKDMDQNKDKDRDKDKEKEKDR